MVYHGISMGIPGSQNGGAVPYCWPYFVGIFPYIGLIYGRYLQFRILKYSTKYIGGYLALIYLQGQYWRPCRTISKGHWWYVLSTSDLYSQGVLIRMCLNDHIVGPGLTPNDSWPLKNEKTYVEPLDFSHTLFSDKPTWRMFYTSM